ncbi:hypothetical protein [uncultured Ilyobacter sp.]|nr:hypothetical protein [uncultured Ilyobacter sp.]
MKTGEPPNEKFSGMVKKNFKNKNQDKVAIKLEVNKMKSELNKKDSVKLAILKIKELRKKLEIKGIMYE